MSTVSAKMTALANEIRELSGTTVKKGLDAMTSDVSEANTEVSSQEDLISQITLALANKTAGSGSGDGIILPTLSNPATEDEVFLSQEYIDENGAKKTGTFTIENELTTQDDLITQIQSALEGKSAGGSTSSKPEQEKTIEITENGTYEVTPDSGYAISKVTAIVNVASAPTETFKDLYQRVEYIESAEEGTYPYFITDFIADNTCGLEVIASFPAMQDRIPMGSRLDSNATRFYCVYPLSTSSCYYGFNTGASISCSLSINTKYRLQTNFLNSRLVNIYDMDGTRKGGTSISATLTQQTSPVSIFGYNNASSGTVSSKREFKLYSARCSKEHEVVRDYVPCYRKGDGVVGLYEKCTGTFLTSASGTFAKGADIEW